MQASANRLAQEKSPYLLQHAGNPVHWQPWDDTALREAKESGKPILLSIGYAACHWCHVMAHESFEDQETAALMNRLFVNIKVDREERPDIDHIYMTALHALGEQGGWPLTMFLTPEAVPFWGGTYFPPQPRWGRPSFRQILQGAAHAFEQGDAAVSSNGATLMRALEASASITPGGSLGPDVLTRVANAYLGLVDPTLGGLRGAPKFPNAPVFRFLWQYGQRTRSASARDAVHLLLGAMSQGGIYDHLGGGYARYSTDAEWLAPHFEKMLYDNAQILELLALCHAERPEDLYAQRAVETVQWLTRDMMTQGAFAASEDADSEGEEGRFYVWSAAEVRALLGAADYALFASVYDVTEGGNWEGHTILRRRNGLGDEASERILARCRATLLSAREKRPRPGRDDKVLADWNGLMIAALARASSVFRQPAWLALAGGAFDRVLFLLGQDGGRVAHAWRDGQITAVGLLDDQAAMARAAFALFEATGDDIRLTQAAALAEAALTWFGAPDGSVYLTGADASDLPGVRPRTASDNAVPNGTGLLAETFARLHYATGRTEWRKKAERLIQAHSGAEERLAGMTTILAAADTLENAATIVIVGPDSSALAETALRLPDPACICIRVQGTSTLPASHPAAGKMSQGDKSAAFLCRAGVCGMPAYDAETLLARFSGESA